MKRQTSSGVSLRVTRVIKAPREQVFRAWTEPAQVVKWWAPEQFVEPTAEVELRVGGRFRLGMRPKDGLSFYAVGTFREVKPFERLVYTWRWDPPGPWGSEETLVTVEFKERGARETEMILVHERFVSEEERDQHAQGWAGCLERLENVVT